MVQEDELRFQNVVANVSYWNKSKVFNTFISSSLPIEVLVPSEKQEDIETLDTKILELTKMIQNSKYCVFFTGAGISTSAGIPDYRGPNGCWTAFKKKQELPNSTKILSANPTFTHKSITKLIKEGFGRFVVTTNVDGLHHLSGLEHNKELVHLHGCIFTERCTTCRNIFVRDTLVRTQIDIHNHRVGMCTLCNSKPKSKEFKVTTNASKCGTMDTIINFAEALDTYDVNLASKHLRKADLCIIVGTSLSLRHISDLPFTVKKNKGKVVLINLQPTQDDMLSDLRIFGNCDDVFEKLMYNLGLEVQ